MREKIETGYQVYVSDDDEAFGAVREVSKDGVVLDVENAGDDLFFVPFDAVESVHSQKVVFKCGKLDIRLRQAIGHAHDGEDPQYR